MQPRVPPWKALAQFDRPTRHHGWAACFLALLLSTVVMAQTRDPLWVLLSDNADIDLPRFETGATYTCAPAATAPAEIPAEVRASPHAGGLGRLQDAGRTLHPGSPSLGWNAAHAEVTFNLKRPYRIEAVELLFMSGTTPEAIHLECRAADSSEWQAAGTLPHPAGKGNFWQLIVLKTPQRAAEVRLALDGKPGGFQVSEARIWGRLEEADPAQMSPAAGDGGRELTLVGDGRAEAVIVVGSPPGLKTTAAARLLQDMLFRMTGTLLPVVERSDRIDLPRLLVGPAAAAEAGVSVPQTYPENEHFLLRRTGRDVVIAGNDASPDTVGDPDVVTASGKGPGRGQDPTGFHGTMTAVCAFLELQGARFYRWDDVAKYLIIPAAGEPPRRVAGSNGATGVHPPKPIRAPSDVYARP